MNMFKKQYDTATFASLIGVTANNIRDWRRRGVYIGMDASVNYFDLDGTLKCADTYSDFDVFEGLMFSHLRQLEFDGIKTAFKAARYISPAVAESIGLSTGGHRYPELTNKGRYVAFTSRGEVEISDNPVELLGKLTHPISTVIDTRSIANAVASKVKERFGEYFVQD